MQDTTDSSLENQNSAAMERQRRLLSFMLSKKVPPIPEEEERKKYPESHSNPISRLMFWWLNPIMRVGYKRTLTENDLFYLEENQKLDYLYGKFLSYYKNDVKIALHKYLSKKFSEEGKTFNPDDPIDPSDTLDFVIPTFLIPICLFKTLKWEYSLGMIYKILSDCASATSPLLQRKLINYVAAKKLGLESNVGKGVGYAVGVCLMIFFTAIAISHSFHNLQTSGAKSRGILTRLLLDKALSVDAKGNHLFPAGNIQSMISTDINRIDLAIGFFPFIVTAIFPLAICIGLLIWNIGVAALVGIAIFILVVLFLGTQIGQLLSIRKDIIIFTDLRVNLMKELLKNYKMIKFYSWENSYSERIKEARVNETKHLLNLQSKRNNLISLAFAMPALATMATFCTAFDISIGGKTAADVFSSLSLFQVLSIQFMVVPMALSATTDMIVSFKKFNKFLSCQDINEEQFKIETFKSDHLAVDVKNASFEWDTFDDDLLKDDKDKDAKANDKKGKNFNLLKKFKKSKNVQEDKKVEVSSFVSTEIESNEKNISSSSSMHLMKKTIFQGLNNLNFNIKKGEFVVVTGSIGSGKSSLLDAIAGLMKRTQGEVLVDGDILLCGYPWVQNATVRDNILFGLPYDENKYHTVVNACSLKNDFEQFPGGDLTEVGERGITLSGGQKARINLARAIYADKDIVLLDDILSAVDAKVGKHIVENCILGLLKDKTRIMATHQLSLIDSADRMIFLNGDGSIDIGTINELKQRNKNLLKLLNFQSSNSNSESKEDEEIANEEENILKEQHQQVLQKIKTENEGPYNGNEIVKIVGDEERAVNALSFKVYWNYCKLAFGNYQLISPILFVTFAILTTFCNIFTNTWLTFWIESKFDGRSKSFYMGIYIMFTFLYTFFLTFFFYLFCVFTNNAARLLNLNASAKILHVPMSFMDVSPLGRVLNRFTKDTDVLDNELVEQLRQFINPFCNIIGTIILCIIYIPWFAIAVPLIIIFYVVIANYYQATAREIKRLEAVKRSLVYSHFNEILSGKDTIRAYKLLQTVKLKLNNLIDSQNEAYFLTLANQRWLGTNLSVISFAIVFIIAMLCVFSVFNVSPASTGLLLTYVMNITGIMTMMMRALTQVENEFNSVERINHYAFDLIQEPAYEIPGTDPEENWPANGEIIFNNVSMKYRPELPYVLKNINMNILKTQKIGFCGRTGAGKSTFMTCLYRFTEFEGEILIDNVDIKKLGLHKLRSKLTIIPQDPVLFVGTIRENLDPFKEYSDEKLWEALSISGLINKDDLSDVKLQKNDDVNLHKFHLNRTVEDDGSNFSIGERQLIALARALVRKTKILILDEATSSVDYETDSKIQKTISTEFKDCTILCIAHRLNTILNYDKIVVMNEGQIVEFDKPKNLFLNENGIFRSMCDQAKITIDDFN